MITNQTSPVAEFHPLDELQLRPRAFGFHFADNPEKQTLLEANARIAAAIGIYACYEDSNRIKYGISNSLMDTHDQQVNESLFTAYDELIEPLRQDNAISPALRKFSKLALAESLPHMKLQGRRLLGGIALSPQGAGLFISRNLQLEVNSSAARFVAEYNDTLVPTKEQRKIAQEIAARSYHTSQIADATSKVINHLIAANLPAKNELGIESSDAPIAIMTVLPVVRTESSLAA